MTGKITLVLADDHHLVRQGLRALLEIEPDLEVVGEASDGAETIELVARLGPDVLLVDLMMPGLGGLDVTAEIAQRSPRSRVLILSMHASEAYLVEALRRGAVGYVLKDATAAELVRAVREVAAGRRYLSTPLSEALVAGYVRRAAGSPLHPVDTLTDRERQVLRLVAEGVSNAEIATRLRIAPRTVETHRANFMRKLDLHSQGDVVRFAVRQGLLPAP